MRRCVLVLFALMMIVPLRAEAQGINWEDGCIDRVVNAIAPTTDVLDYVAACAHYRACDPSGNGDALCQFETFVFLLDQCPLDGDMPESRCHDGALLYAAAMLAYDLGWGESVYWVPPDSIIQGVPLALAAYWQGDDGEALAQYQRTPFEVESFDINLPLSRAVMYQRLDRPDSALVEYDNTFNIEFAHPLLSYARSQLYASLGRDTEAAIDIAAVAAYVGDDPEVANFVTGLQARYPLDEMAAGQWLLYPVSDINSGVAGQFVSDRSLEPPRPIQFAVFEDLNLIAAVGLKNWDSGGFTGADASVLQILRGDADGTAFLDVYPTYWDNTGALSLARDGNVFTGREYIYFFEGGGEWEFMIAPVGAPDPRASLDSQRVCPGGVVPRVRIGSVLMSVRYGYDVPPLMADAPGGELMADDASPDLYVVVVGGPECVGDVTWWQGYNPSGVTGWFPENEGRTYTVLPWTNWDALPVSCGPDAPALPTRLSVGESARVVAGLGTNNVRDFPSADGALLGTIPEAGVIDVTGGPVCVDGMVWWTVDYDGLTGWTAEGEGDVYWLEPVE